MGELEFRLNVPVELGHAKAVDSEDLDGTTFVSAELTGADLNSDDPVGAWAVVDEEIYAVNAVAREFSDWPDGTAKHSLSMEDDGAEEFEECVEAAVQ